MRPTCHRTNTGRPWTARQHEVRASGPGLCASVFKRPLPTVSASEDHNGERRRFPRIAAPMYCRPARRRLLRRRRKVIDVSLGGMRVYSDERFDLGKRFEIDLLLHEGDDFVTCLTEVVWIREIAGSDPAPFDVGLRFLEVPPRAHEMLKGLQDSAPDPDER